MKPKMTGWLAWGLFGVISSAAILQLGINLVERGANATGFELAQAVSWVAVPVVFSLVGALILSRQPRNPIGWLLMCPAIVMVIPVESYLSQFPIAPARPGFLLLLALWYGQWSWLLLIFPILFIPLLFPTGRPPSPRWRWLIVAGVAMCAFLFFGATFVTELGPISGEFAEAWTVPNPIGFLIPDVYTFPIVPWFISLGIITILCTASLFVRYRRAAAVERQQIKWLLFACGLFAAIYVSGSFRTEEYNRFNEVVDALLFLLAMPMIPVAIGIAILRYRLWDIDVIIRKTLVYGALTATLALVFFGGVTLLQQVVGRLTGTEGSPVAIVLSTLAIAALFAPLRRRIQDFIDRRFYRRKYNAEQALEEFAATARNETDLEALTGKLVEVVSQTMQPEQVSLWVKPTSERKPKPMSGNDRRSGVGDPLAGVGR